MPRRGGAAGSHIPPVRALYVPSLHGLQSVTEPEPAVEIRAVWACSSMKAIPGCRGCDGRPRDPLPSSFFPPPTFIRIVRSGRALKAFVRHGVVGPRASPAEQVGSRGQGRRHTAGLAGRAATAARARQACGATIQAHTQVPGPPNRRGAHQLVHVLLNVNCPALQVKGAGCSGSAAGSARVGTAGGQAARRAGAGAGQATSRLAAAAPPAAAAAAAAAHVALRHRALHDGLRPGLAPEQKVEAKLQGEVARACAAGSSRVSSVR